MRRHRLAGPDRTGLLGGGVTHREHEIELRRTGFCELGPALGPKIAHVEVHSAQQVERVGMDLPFRLASRREGAEMAASFTVEDRLGHDRPRRISGAQEQNVEGL
jgi:hypothetical protein